MKINYKGHGDGFKYRLAEIEFDGEKELSLIAKMIKVLEIKGWNVQFVDDNYAYCEVKNAEEYKAFVEDYKRIKKSAKLWARYGF